MLSFGNYVLYRESLADKLKALEKRIANVGQPPGEVQPAPLPTPDPVLKPRPVARPVSPPPATAPVARAEEPPQETPEEILARWRNRGQVTQGLGGEEEHVQLPAHVSDLLTNLFKVDVKVDEELVNFFALKGHRHHWVAPTFDVTASRVYPFYRHSSGTIHSVPGFRVFDIIKLLGDEIRAKKEREKKLGRR